MSKVKYSFLAMASAVILALGIAMPAMADPVVVDETPVNPATTPVPFQEIVHAGSSVNMTGIVYKATVAARTYDSTPATGVYAYAGTIANSPITINSGAASSDTDDIDTWDATRTLAELFGSDAAADAGTSAFATNFPQAGMYEFTITGSHEGGSSTDTAKWSYDEPQYLLQVAIKTKAGDVTSREYAGWTLSKWNPEANGGTGGYEKINSGATGVDGKAAFEADYIAKSQLNITKQVSGEYASTTYQFPQTITVQLPEWYDETRDGAITPAAGEPATANGITITRDASSSGNTLVFTTALAHDQTASFTVPVGTRYEVLETTNASGKAIDSAGIQYDPKIDWTVDGGQVTIMKAWNNLMIPDLSYEETMDMLNNTVVSWHGQTRPFLSEWSADKNYWGNVWIEGYYDNIYSGTRDFQFGLSLSCSEENEATYSNDMVNMPARASTSGFTTGRLDIQATTNDATTHTRIDAPNSWDIKDLKIISNGKTYAFDQSDSFSVNEIGFAIFDPFVQDNTIVRQEDLLTFVAIVVNGLAKNPDISPSYYPVQYETGNLGKDWGYLHAESSTQGQLFVSGKVTADDIEDLSKLSADLLEIAKDYWDNPNMSRLQSNNSYYLRIDLNISEEAKAALIASGITTQGQLADYLVNNSDAWHTWLSQRNFAVAPPDGGNDIPIGSSIVLSFNS